MALSKAFTVGVCTCSGYCAYSEHVPARSSDHAGPSHQTGRIVAWGDLTPQPWRNGGGVTREILSRRRSNSGAWVPAGDDWDWRLSIADVDRAGAFSSFPGMTRTLTVIEGATVTLTIGGVTKELEKHRPFTFDGGASTSAEIPHGPIRDLNLIVRTGVVNAEVSVTTLSAGQSLRASDGQYCVLLDGQAAVMADALTAGSADLALNPFDTVLGSATPPTTISGEGTLAIITVATAGSGAPEML